MISMGGLKSKTKAMKTKVLATLENRTLNEDGSLNVTFKVDNFRFQRYLKELEKKEYSLEISEIRQKRSLEQNRMLWALIHEIAMNENAPINDDWEMYCYFLSLAKAKYTYISVIEDGLEDLKKEVRALRVLSYEKRKNGKRFANCQVFIGSSKMSKEEMSKLIDVVLQYAEELGIDTEYYKRGGLY